MRPIEKHNDHFFRGLDILKNVKFQKEPTLQEFETAVKKDVGIRASVDASHVTMGKSAIYKAQVLIDGHSWLYLLFPQSILAEKFYVIGKKPTSNDNEGDIFDKIEFSQRQASFGKLNSPFAKLARLKEVKK